MRGLRIASSARRHGVREQSMLEVLHNPLRVEQQDGLMRVLGAERAGVLHELGVIESGEEIVVIVYARPCASAGDAG